MEKIKNFILKHSDDILIVICLFLAVLFSNFLSAIMDIYNITSLHRLIIIGFVAVSVTFLDTAFDTFKHKSKR